MRRPVIGENQAIPLLKSQQKEIQGQRETELVAWRDKDRHICRAK